MAKLTAKSTSEEMDAHVQAHLAKYRDELALPHADLVQIWHDQRLLLIHLSNKRRMVIPLEDLQGLSGADPDQLSHYEMLGEGRGIDWPGLNVSYSISGLLDGMYGNQLWMREFRRKSASIASEPNQQGSRAKAAKGGRSRKARLPAA